MNLAAGSFHGFNRRWLPKARVLIRFFSSSLRQSQMEEFSGWLKAHRLIEGACPAGGHCDLSRVSASRASDDRIHQACSDSASASRFDHLKFQYLSDQAVCIERGYIDCVYVAKDIVVVFCNQEVGHWRIDGNRVIAIEVRARGPVARCEDGEQPEYRFDVGCGGLTDGNPRNTLVASSHSSFRGPDGPSGLVCRSSSRIMACQCFDGQRYQLGQVGRAQRKSMTSVEMIMSSGKGIKFAYRAGGIAVHEERLLVEQNIRHDFCIAPGGRVEYGENAIEALEREFREELGEEVRVGRLVFVADILYELVGNRYQEICLYFLIEFVPESDVLRPQGPFMGNESGITFQWIPLDDVEEAKLFPAFLRDRVRAILRFPEYVAHAETISSSTVRAETRRRS